jgi:uncharacterized pyridoxamine 5'-phosphate oxidase family protein
MHVDAHQRISEVLDSESLAVVATSDGGAPYCSLVAIAAPATALVYFATTRSTHKWENISADPRVSVLVDNRRNDPVDFHEATAATGVGIAEECLGEDAVNARAALLGRHPYLVDFLESPSTVLVRVRIDRWYVVARFQQVDCVDCAGLS